MIVSNKITSGDFVMFDRLLFVLVIFCYLLADPLIKRYTDAHARTVFVYATDHLVNMTVNTFEVICTHSSAKYMLIPMFDIRT